MKFKTIIVFSLMLIVALFSVQNAEVITVRFVVWQFALSQALVILLSAFCGGVAGLAFGTLSSMGGGKTRPAKPDTP